MSPRKSMSSSWHTSPKKVWPLMGPVEITRRRQGKSLVMTKRHIKQLLEDRFLPLDCQQIFYNHLSNVCKVRELWQHIWRSFTTFFHDVTYPWWRSNKLLFSIENSTKGKLTKKCWAAKLQVIEKKNTGRSPLRFLKKCVGRNLNSARSLYSFDDVTGQMIELPPNKTPFSLDSGIRRTEDQ